MIPELKKPIRVLTVATACALLSACASVVHKPLSDTSRNNLRGIEMRVVVQQEGPIFSARAPGVAAAAGGGLIPALIDASVQKSRQETLVSKLHPVLEAVHDSDFRDEYATGLKEALQDGFPLKVEKLSVVPGGLSREAANAAIAATKDGTGLLQLITYYELEPNLSALTIRTSASLWSEGNPEKSYNNHLIFQATSGSLDLDRNIELWGADSGRRVREQYQAGVRETLRMLTLDLGAREAAGKQNAAAATSATEKFGFNQGGSILQLEGTLLASEGGRATIRDKAGALFSLPR